MEVLVMGAGYVGLVQGAGLASSGNEVTLVDISRERIDMLRLGGCPIFEVGLPELLAAGVKKKCLSFCYLEDPSFKEKLKSAEVVFLAVGTPEGHDGLPQMDHLFSAASMLINTGIPLDEKLVVVKSTVPVGTGDKLEKFFKEKGGTPKVISNPEFLKQGAAVQDFMKPERVVIGTSDIEAAKTLHFLYKPFMMKRDRFIVMSRRSAELVKYACNSFLAAKISFINEMSQLAEAVGADIREIREGMITDSRIGDQFLYPGIGYGGSCFPKDTHSLIAQGERAGVPAKIIMAADEINQKQKLWPVRKLKEILGSLDSKTIAFWGLAFKPNTDDLREAPALYCIDELVKQGARVQAHDPVAMERAKKELGSHISSGALKLYEDPYEAASRADALVVMTEWQNFRSPSFVKLKNLMKGREVLDGRLIYEPEILHKFGFRYHGVGVISNNPA